MRKVAGVWWPDVPPPRPPKVKTVEPSEVLRAVRAEVRRVLGPKAQDAKHTDERKDELLRKREGLKSDLRRLGEDLASAEAGYVESLGIHAAMNEWRDKQRAIREQMVEVRAAMEELETELQTGYSMETLRAARADLRAKAPAHIDGMRNALAAALHLYGHPHAREGLPDAITEGMQKLSQRLAPREVASEDPGRDLRVCLRVAGRHAERLLELLAEDKKAFTVATSRPERFGPVDPPLMHLDGVWLVGLAQALGQATGGGG